MNVVTGLGHQAADTTAVHSLSPTTWLSGVRPKATQGVDAYAGITADQIAAQAIGQDSSLPSMELATEDHSGLIGSCDRDYGCIYMNTLSWRTPTTPLPMEINPRKVFERMFGQGGSAAERVARIQEDRSILDAIAKEAAGLQVQLGAADRQTMTQYLDNVREIERRIQRAEKVQGDEALLLPTRPAGVPFDFEEHVRLMYDLMVLAYQANITRVITFMVSREVSNRTYPQVGVTDGHHAISHHQNRAEKMEKNVRIQTFNVGMFAEFVEKLQKTPDGDGTLLDNIVLLYGSNMSNSNAHDHFPLPNLVVGGASGRHEGRPPPALRRPHADDEPAGGRARQGRRAAGEARRQHGGAGGPVGADCRWRLRTDCRWRLVRTVAGVAVLRLRSQLHCVGVCCLSAAAANAQAPDRRLANAVKAATTPRRPARCCAPRSTRTRRRRTAPRRCTGRCATTTWRSSIGCSRAGANAKAQNRYGVTPIQLACENGSAPVVDTPARSRRAAPTATGPLGETALHTCARSGDVAAAKVLLRARRPASTPSRAGAARRR